MSNRKRFGGKKIAFLWRASVDGISHFMVTADPVRTARPSVYGTGFPWELIGLVQGEARKMTTSNELCVRLSEGVLRGVLVSAEVIGCNRFYRPIKH